MVDQVSLAHQTVFLELLQQCLDAEFDESFPENGSFTKLRGHNGELFWYYKGYKRTANLSNPEEKRFSKYVGPVSDPEINARVQHFQRAKAGYRERRSLVTSLVAAGFPSPPSIVGEVVETLWKAGLFRLHGVLVGTVAFQTYAGLLGVRLRSAPIMTGDVDFAQFHSISVSVDDSIPPVLDALRGVDSSFREVPTIAGPNSTTRYANATGFSVEFLTPNYSKDEYGSEPTPMPALGGASAQPLRFLDFLIHQPVRSVLLHKGGVAVLVPSPERFAIHKLIVSELRIADSTSRAKSRKDMQQATILIDALTSGGRTLDLGVAWMEAWNRGPRWREVLSAARENLNENSERRMLNDSIAAAVAAEARREKSSDDQ